MRTGLRDWLRRLRRPLGSTSPWLLGVAAAAWAAVIGLVLAAVPMLVAWIASPATGLTWQESLRVAATIWSVAQTTPLAVAGVTYSLAPWGLALVALLLVSYGGRWALDRCAPGRPTVVLVATTIGVYAVLAACVAGVSGPSATEVEPVWAALHAAALASLGMLVAVLRAGRLRGAAVPPSVVVVLRAGLAGAAALLGFGALAAAVVLATHVDEAARVFADLHAGAAGGLVVVMIALGYLPVLAVWATSYLLGAGVLLGPAVTVSPFVAVTPSTLLPPFPLLVAVPATAGPLAWGLPALGVVAGIGVGLIVGRGARRESRLVRVGLAAGAAAVSAVILAALAGLSSGSLGDLRLAHVGPAPLAVGVLACILLAAGAMPVAAIRPTPMPPGLRVAPGDPAPHADAGPFPDDAAAAGDGSDSLGGPGAPPTVDDPSA